MSGYEESNSLTSSKAFQKQDSPLAYKSLAILA